MKQKQISQTILSLSNPRVKQWTQLQERKHRNREGRFIAEGIHLVQEALRSKVEVECVVFREDLGFPDELSGFRYVAEDVEWIGVTEAILKKCTETETPQPVFAVVKKSPADWRLVFEDVNALVVAVDGVQDPGNLGTIIRTADAVGATGVVLGKGTVDLYNSKTVRSTMGSLFHLPVVEGDLLELLPEAKRHGAHVVSTSLQATDTCYSYSFAAPTWLVVGNEGKGVSAEVQAQVDATMIIPMRGQAESLNVAMATSVLLYEAMRQRHYKIM